MFFLKLKNVDLVPNIGTTCTQIDTYFWYLYYLTRNNYYLTNNVPFCSKRCIPQVLIDVALPLFQIMTQCSRHAQVWLSCRMDETHGVVNESVANTAIPFKDEYAKSIMPVMAKWNPCLRDLFGVEYRSRHALQHPMMIKKSSWLSFGRLAAR